MLLRWNNVVTLSRRNNDVIITWCVRWDRTTLPLRPRLYYIKHTVHWLYCSGCWYHLGSAYLHIISGEIETVFDILAFLKWPPFWGHSKRFYQKWYLRLSIPAQSQEYFQHFELLIDALAKALMEDIYSKVWSILWSRDVIDDDQFIIVKSSGDIATQTKTPGENIILP